MNGTDLLDPLCYDAQVAELGYDPTTETAAFSALAGDPWAGKLEDLPERYGFRAEKEKDEPNTDGNGKPEPVNPKVLGIKRVAASLKK
jgi:hypothetical protein